MPGLPSGTVTFLFTDIEGSTKLLAEIGSERYGLTLADHRTLVREALAACGGVEVDAVGDGLFYAFARASDALTAAGRSQAALGEGPIRIRVGIHTGEALVVDDGYVGLDVHKAARICAAGHGGQVLVSEATRSIAGAHLRDLGEHRLKDLGAPVRLYQLGEGDFAPLQSLNRTNLPLQATIMLGRENELTELLVLTRRSRLLTLTGAGGTGKTRLALQVAAELAGEYADGVWWVPLGSVSDPLLVEPTIARILGARDTLAEHLASKRLLILLDNLEQVLEAAPVLAQLLAGAPGLSLITTSRERLAISGEQEYPVLPLGDSAAISLFVSRARQLKPDFAPDEAVAELCRRLDGLPLALELAAARVKVMTPGQILARLERRLELLTGGPRDAPERHKTMQAAVEWSYGLLSEEERRVFCALAVFAGDFELEAAEAVCDSDLDMLQALVDKSLLRPTGRGRISLLETVREFALARLEDLGETAELRRRHAAWFLKLGKSALLGLRSAEQGAWLVRLRADTDNLRAVLAWALEEDVSQGVQLARALLVPWRMRGQVTELLRWYEEALGDPERIPVETRAAGLGSFGTALFFHGEPERAGVMLKASLALFSRLGDEREVARALNGLGGVCWATGANDEAIRLREKALAICRRLGDRSGTANSLHLLGETLRDVGQLQQGSALLEEAVAIWTDLGDQHMMSASLHSLADAALDERNPLRAAERYRQALAIALELGDESNEAYCVAGLASVAALRGESNRAGRLWGIAESFEDRFGFRILSAERARYEKILSALADAAAFQAGVDAGRELSLERAIADLIGA
jgi:predicted ATPase/class 3 adenylate cyclase